MLDLRWGCWVALDVGWNVCLNQQIQTKQFLVWYSLTGRQVIQEEGEGEEGHREKYKALLWGTEDDVPPRSGTARTRQLRQLQSLMAAGSNRT